MTHSEAHPPFPDKVGRRKVVTDKERSEESHHRHSEWVADSLLGDEESAGGELQQPDYDMGTYPELEHEVVQEQRVSSFMPQGRCIIMTSLLLGVLF